MKNYQIEELSSEELKSIDGGWIQYAVALAGACAWVWEKGEELGKAMA